MSFFSGKEFDEISVGDPINAEYYCKAGKIIPAFFDVIKSKTLDMVKKDADNNLIKMEDAIKINVKEGKNIETLTLKDMLEADIARGTQDKDPSAAVALIWFNRGLKFMYVMCEKIVKDHADKVDTENVSKFCKEAYDESLCKYHGFAMKPVFKVATGKALPCRTDFIKQFMGSATEDELYQELNHFIQRIKPYIETVNEYYIELNLKTKDTV